MFIFFFVVSISGLFLGWKKHSGGIILPETQKGKSADSKDWLPMSDIEKIAKQTAQGHLSPNLSDEIDRIDVRPTKGVAKVRLKQDSWSFRKQDYWEIQIDLTTGEILDSAPRRSDFIESIHDGSVIDNIFGLKGGYVKLIYTSILGTALLTFTITGFWLWFGPKRLKSARSIANKDS